MNRATDEYLLKRASEGDCGSMDVLVSRYHAHILDFAWRQTGNRETAADIAQLAFVRAYQSASSFACRSSFRTWFYSITINLIRDEMRRQGRRGELFHTDLTDSDDFEISCEEPGYQISDAQDIWQAIDRLPQNQRMAILLRFRHQFAHSEIAEALGAPEGTVRSWIHHALKALKKALASDIIGAVML